MPENGGRDGDHQDHTSDVSRGLKSNQRVSLSMWMSNLYETSHMLLCGNLASSTLHQQGASSVEKTREREDIGF